LIGWLREAASINTACPCNPNESEYKEPTSPVALKPTFPVIMNSSLQLHVVFKAHLDIGFTDLAANVVEEYLHFFIPRAISISRRLRETGRRERFVWTTGSWLIHQYFETRSPAECANLERAILDGDIVWHGLPFTMHSELADASLFEAGLAISQDLDARFGKKTIAAKLTDVPGNTRGIVPLMAAAGIRFLHIGVNGACSAPEVPELFKWRDEATKTEIIVMQHQGYGGLHIDNELGLLVECTSENDPPPSVQAIVPFFLRLEEKYPQAEIIGSTLDAYAKLLIERNIDLPVVTSEIGDSWIRGAASDPVKLSQLRDLLRLHRKWVSLPGRDSVRPFAKKLLMVTEHTWGLDSIMYMADQTSYTPETFLPALEEGRFKTFEASWKEQASYIEEAIATLDSDKAGEARYLLSRRDSWPDPKSFRRVNASDTFDTQHFTLVIDPASGGVSHLKSGNHIWADENHRLFEFAYQLYSPEDFVNYLDDYVVSSLRNEWWIPSAIARHDLTQLRKVSGLWTANLKELLHTQNIEGDYFQVSLTAPSGVPAGYGFPESPYLRLFFPNAEHTLHAEIGWSGKQPCRHPEAIWLQLNPKVGDPAAWRMDKLGSKISPFDVVNRAGSHLHAVGEEVSCRSKSEQIIIRPTDAPLVSFGKRGLLCADNQEISAEGGLHFNLYNNTWGTNFPLWFGGPCSFRFTLEFSDPICQAP